MQNPKVIDADGHIYENHEEIEEYFEGKYRGMRRARAYPLFPSLDGWPRGLGAGRPDKVTETRPEDVIKFVDNMGLESTVLYPTAGLAIGLVQNPEWACSIARAYNNWFHAPLHQERLALEGQSPFYPFKTRRAQSRSCATRWKNSTWSALFYRRPR